MTLIHRLTRTLDPLHGLPSATRQDFACWYRQTKLPQVRQLAFLTMALYLVYALIEQNVAQDQLGLRLLAHGLLVPLALLAVGVLSYFEAWHRWMLAILCVAPVGSVGKLGQDAGREGFDMRQPQHIPLAANLGLGVFEFAGGKDQLDHRIIQVEA